MNSSVKNWIFYICATLLVISAALYITDIGSKYVPYIYAIAGAGIAVTYLTNPYRGDNLRLKRLNIQQAIAGILLPVSSYFMFHQMNEWFLILFVSALLQLYVVFVRDYEEKKEKKG